MEVLMTMHTDSYQTGSKQFIMHFQQRGKMAHGHFALIIRGPYDPTSCHVDAGQIFAKCQQLIINYNGGERNGSKYSNRRCMQTF